MGRRDILYRRPNAAGFTRTASPFVVRVCGVGDIQACGRVFPSACSPAMHFVKPSWLVHQGTRLVPVLLSDAHRRQRQSAHLFGPHSPRWLASSNRRHRYALSPPRAAAASILWLAEWLALMLDGKIRIWSTKAIYDPVLEESDDEPKLLCTLSTHTGPLPSTRCAPADG